MSTLHDARKQSEPESTPPISEAPLSKAPVSETSLSETPVSQAPVAEGSTTTASASPTAESAAPQPYRANGVEHETSDEEAEEIGEAIIAAIKTCYDPEIPVDIYELGLIYAVELEGRHAIIRMTLTSPMCPVAESLPVEVEHKVREVEGVETAEIDLVWEPQWSPEMMSEAARLELGF